MRLRGGLGNQMFQYAAGRAVALRQGVELLLDGSALTDPDRPFALDGLAIQARALTCDEGFAWTELREAGFTFDPQVTAAPAGRRLDGYFQSERYFADYAAAVRSELAPAGAPSADFQRAAARIEASAHSVSIHVRRGDYARDARTRAFHGLLEADYYAAALDQVRARGGGAPELFLFSDEPDAAAALLAPRLGPLTPVRAAAPWEDLHLIARCRSHIGANSSFSWWGAWLDPRPDKLVIAPHRWASPEAGLDTRDLHPAGVVLV